MSVNPTNNICFPGNVKECTFTACDRCFHFHVPLSISKDIKRFFFSNAVHSNKPQIVSLLFK